VPISRQIRRTAQDDENKQPHAQNGRFARSQSGDALPARDRPSATGARSPNPAYPGIEFSRRSRNWWSWLKGTPPECIHLEDNAAWIATLVPDTLYLRGKRSYTRESPRPEVSLCRECLIDVVEPEFAAYKGQVVAFDPDPDTFTQYFFVAVSDFEAAGLKPEVAKAMEERLHQKEQTCAACARPANWLWFSHEHVPSLDEVERIRQAAGEWLCAEHGSQKLCRAFERISEANVFYINLPYADAGVYVWI
jgi:hypothetical protein